MRCETGAFAAFFRVITNRSPATGGRIGKAANDTPRGNGVLTQPDLLPSCPSRINPLETLKKFLVLPVSGTFVPKGFRQWILLGGGETQVIPASPTLGVFKHTGHSAHLATERFHRIEIGIDSLTDIEPVLLATVGG